MKIYLQTSDALPQEIELTENTLEKIFTSDKNEFESYMLHNFSTLGNSTSTSTSNSTSISKTFSSFENLKTLLEFHTGISRNNMKVINDGRVILSLSKDDNLTIQKHFDLWNFTLKNDDLLVVLPKRIFPSVSKTKKTKKVYLNLYEEKKSGQEEEESKNQKEIGSKNILENIDTETFYNHYYNEFIAQNNTQLDEDDISPPTEETIDLATSHLKRSSNSISVQIRRPFFPTNRGSFFPIPPFNPTNSSINSSTASNSSNSSASPNSSSSSSSSNSSNASNPPNSSSSTNLPTPNTNSESSEPIQPPQIDPSLIQILTEMGFKEEHARKALILNLLDVEKATNWLLEHVGDDDIDSPIPNEFLARISRSMSSNSQFTPDQTALENLKEMGFNEEDAIKALKATNNNQEAACAWLLGDIQSDNTSDSVSGLESLLSDPIIRAGLSNPRVFAAFRAILENPSVAPQFLNDPEIAPLLFRVIGNWSSGSS